MTSTVSPDELIAEYSSDFPDDHPIMVALRELRALRQGEMVLVPREQAPGTCLHEWWTVQPLPHGGHYHECRLCGAKRPLAAAEKGE